MCQIWPFIRNLQSNCFTHTLCYQLGYSYTWFSCIAQEDGPKHLTFNIIFYDATIWKINLGITHQHTFKKIKTIFLLVEFILSLEVDSANILSGIIEKLQMNEKCWRNDSDWGGKLENFTCKIGVRWNM